MKYGGSFTFVFKWRNLLTTSLIYFFYYLEFKKMLNKVDLMKSGIRDNQLTTWWW